MKIEIWGIYRNKDYSTLKVRIEKIISPDDYEYNSVKKEADYKWRAKLVKYLKTTLISRDKPFSKDWMYMVWMMTLTDFKRNYEEY